MIIVDMGGCENYGPFWGTLNIRCRNIIRTQKGNPNSNDHPSSKFLALT